MVNIKDVPMFANLDKRFHKELYDTIHIRQFTQNNILFYEGDSSDYLHILLDGQVRL